MFLLEHCFIYVMQASEKDERKEYASRTIIPPFICSSERLN